MRSFLPSIMAILAAVFFWNFLFCLMPSSAFSYDKSYFSFTNDPYNSHYMIAQKTSGDKKGISDEHAYERNAPQRPLNFKLSLFHRINGYLTATSALTTMALGIVLFDSYSRSKRPPKYVKSVHTVFAYSTAGLATLNLTVGLINFWPFLDFRKGNERIMTHMFLAVISTAGFIANLVLGKVYETDDNPYYNDYFKRTKRIKPHAIVGGISGGVLLIQIAVIKF